MLGASSKVSPAGSSVDLSLIEGLKPRFYTEGQRTFTLDIDLSPEAVQQNRTTAQAAAQQAGLDAATTAAIVDDYEQAQLRSLKAGLLVAALLAFDAEQMGMRSLDAQRASA